MLIPIATALASIAAAILYTNMFEWFAHKVLLHGLGKRRESFWSFHWHEHHRESRKGNMFDPQYERSLLTWSPQAKEAISVAGAIFFWTGVLTACSYLVAARIARRIGLLRTMVFTHLPSSVCLILIPFMPQVGYAIALLFVRSALSQMDVPTRSSYVMAVVSPEERPAAAGITSVPRSLASAASPVIAGWLLGLSPFGWAFVAGGAIKIVYDLLLLAMFNKVRPPEEQALGQRIT